MQYTSHQATSQLERSHFGNRQLYTSGSFGNGSSGYGIANKSPTFTLSRSRLAMLTLTVVLQFSFIGQGSFSNEPPWGAESFPGPDTTDSLPGVAKNFSEICKLSTPASFCFLKHRSPSLFLATSFPWYGLYSRNEWKMMHLAQFLEQIPLHLSILSW